MKPSLKMNADAIALTEKISARLTMEKADGHALAERLAEKVVKPTPVAEKIQAWNFVVTERDAHGLLKSFTAKAVYL